MIAFDADVLSDILRGDAVLTARALLVPAADQAVPIVVVEEILRGRLNSIRQAEAGKGKLTIERAYVLLDATLSAFRHVTLLQYSASAETLCQQWRGAKIRLGTHDLRIAAICIAHSAKLVSRNRRDFDQVPGLDVEYWA